MINSYIVDLINETAQTIISETNSAFSDVKFVCNDEINYEFFESDGKTVQANVLFGASTKDNDLGNKYTQNFVVNIQSELNGYEKAQSLFTEIFLRLNRKYQTFGDYKAKIILTSPVLMNAYQQALDGFVCLLTMSGTVEYSESLYVGAKFELKLGNGAYQEIAIRQPKVVKSAQGGNDTQVFGSTHKTIFNKESAVINANFIMLLDTSNLALSLLDECFGDTDNIYTLKITIGTTIEKVINNLIITQAEYIYDETSGDNVLSFSLNEVS